MTDLSNGGQPGTQTSEQQFSLTGMTCASCVARVEKALAKVPGVTNVSVNLATEQATLQTAGTVTMQAIKAAVEKAVQSAGNVSVQVQISQGKPAASSDSTDGSGIRHILTVGAGKGGVGKSTLSVNLALALKAQGLRVGIMDGDIYGPNLPLMLGIPEGTKPQVSENNKLIPIEAHGLKVISIGLLVPKDQPMVWRGPMLHSAIQQFLQKVEWGSLDFLVVDLPPGTGDIQLSLVQSAKVSGAVVVSTPQEVALEDVRKAVVMFNHLKVPVLGMVENMAGEIFGKGGAEKAAQKLQIPFLGTVELDAQIRKAGDSGQPIFLNPASPASAQFGLIAAKITAALVQSAETQGS